MKKYVISFAIAGLVGLPIIFLGNESDENIAHSDDSTEKQVGEAQKEYLDSKEEETSIMIDTEPSEQLSKDYHKYLKEVLSLRGDGTHSGDDLDETALDHQIQENALNKKAEELDVLPTEEEIEDYVERIKLTVTQGESESGKEVRGQEETYENLKEIMEGLEITEEEYWNEFLPSNSEHVIIEENVREELQTIETTSSSENADDVDEEIDQMKERINEWEEIKNEIVNDYITEYEEEIDDFKSSF
ncbi:hypothetical protein [Salsuginibacillus kocurii]|uniref:hypothetical protein n=1 Tax=Salsuginibacillus kocurii TaxID=427078 RepID=UPI0003690832|nr:hypothetical protein [Salsuginibacillus kocurii]